MEKIFSSSHNPNTNNFAGLNNLGGSWYFNCIIQIFANLKYFNKALNNLNDSNPKICSFKKILNFLNSQSKAVCPDNFFLELGFLKQDVNIQQDIHEFFLKFLEFIIKDEKESDILDFYSHFLLIEESVVQGLSSSYVSKKI